eukprot:1548600-Pleurochrysis_carterae.AAC.2
MAHHLDKDRTSLSRRCWSANRVPPADLFAGRARPHIQYGTRNSGLCVLQFGHSHVAQRPVSQAVTRANEPIKAIAGKRTKGANTSICIAHAISIRTSKVPVPAPARYIIHLLHENYCYGSCPPLLSQESIHSNLHPQ